MTGPTRSPDGRVHVPALDGLRGVAILLVIVSHYLGDYWRSATVGWTGVNLFFVLSGFLITGILLDSKDAPHYFRNFYARRTLRIFPLYYLILMLVFVVARFEPSLNTEGYRAVASHQGWLWTYTMNIFVSFHGAIGQDPYGGAWVKVLHFWSLCVEEQFYFVWPLVVLLVTPRQLRWTCGAMFVGAWGLRIWFTARGNVAAPYFFTLCRVDDLAVGAFIAAMAREKDGLAKLRACAPWVAIISLWVLLGTALHVRHFFQLEPFVQRYAYSAFSALYGAMLVFALTAGRWNWYRVALENPVFRSYGKYSYAIYIFHWLFSSVLFEKIAPLETLADTLGTPDAALTARFIIVAIVSWAIGFLSWHAYEKHFLKLKRAFYTNPKGSPTDFTN